jgi:hypothetical protein
VTGSDLDPDDNATVVILHLSSRGRYGGPGNRTYGERRRGDGDYKSMCHG